MILSSITKSASAALVENYFVIRPKYVLTCGPTPVVAGTAALFVMVESLLFGFLGRLCQTDPGEP